MSVRCGVAVVVVAALASVAEGQGASAEAERLFRDGVALVKAGRIAEGCEALAGSQRLEPHPVTLMNLADCRQRGGQLATAWALFLQAASALRDQPSMAAAARSARDKAAALEPRLSQLTIVVPGDAASLIVTRNGATVDPATWNRPMPVDGGTYTIAARAARGRPWSREVTIASELDRATVAVVMAPPAEPVPAVAATEPPRRAGRRTLALGVGAGALVALGGAVGLELAARGAHDDYQRAQAAGDLDSERLYDDANRKRYLAAGLAVVGGVAAGAALYLWFRAAPRADRRVAIAPAVGGDGGGLVIDGRF